MFHKSGDRSTTFESNCWPAFHREVVRHKEMRYWMKVCFKISEFIKRIPRRIRDNIRMPPLFPPISWWQLDLPSRGLDNFSIGVTNEYFSEKSNVRVKNASTAHKDTQWKHFWLERLFSAWNDHFSHRWDYCPLLIIYVICCGNGIPVLMIVFIYFKLVQYVKGMSKRVTTGKNLFRAQRELKMVERIILIVCILLTFSVTYFIFFSYQFSSIHENMIFELLLCLWI